jgi:hypothetical protein
MLVHYITYTYAHTNMSVHSIYYHEDMKIICSQTKKL